MYVCICRAVTDGQIRAAIDRGMCTRRELAHCLSVGRDCGKCNREVQRLLQSHAATRRCEHASPMVQGL